MVADAFGDRFDAGAEVFNVGDQVTLLLFDRSPDRMLYMNKHSKHHTQNDLLSLDVP